MTAERVRVFDSRGAAYREAFVRFLAHTDQKRNARRWLTAFLEKLLSRRVLVDAGAGNGEVTGWLASPFARTVAIEPNPYLREELRRRAPGADVIGQPILDVELPACGDLVFCSHTFYYIPRDQWLPNLERLVSWTAPSGATVVLLQHHDTDCMAMLDHFHGVRFDLRGLAEEFRAKHGARYAVTVTRDDAHVETQDFDSAYVIAEFMLNLLPLDVPPLKADLEAYVRDRFAAPGGGFRFSCHQDFLEIRPRP